MRITIPCIGLLAYAPQAGSFSVPVSYSKRLAIQPLYYGTAKEEEAAAADDELVELRNKRKAVEMNPSLSRLSSALPVVMETKLYPEKGTVVFNKGDKSNGFYLVKEGTFEAIDDDDVVVTKLQQGDVFGELSVFLSEARSLTVRSATPDASLWFVEKKNYNLIAQLKGTDDQELQSILQNDYNDYMDFRKKKVAMQRFKTLRKALTEDEIDNVARSLTRCSFEAGEDIVLKGSESTDMYFVESGDYQICDCDIEGDFSNQKYFGELSLFLGRPRAVTVRASSPISLFKLSRKDLFDIVDESLFEDENLAMLAEQYREADLLEKCQEVYESIQIKGRPHKEPVSLHATLATIASGMLLLGLVPCLSPGFGENGAFHLYDLRHFSLSVPATQFQTLAFAIVAFSGSLRLPPSSRRPLRLRRHFFNFAALQCIVNYMMQDSNIVAAVDGSRYTFDLLSVNAGSISFWVVFALSNVWATKLISEAICAPRNARSIVPFNGEAAIIASITALMGWLQVIKIPACIYTLDERAFADLYLPFAQTHFETFVLTICIFIQAGLSYFMLSATLLSERKLTQLQCNSLGLLAFEPFVESAVNAIADVSTSPEASAYAQYNNEILFEHLHINQILLLVYGGAAIHGMIERRRNNMASNSK